MTSRTLAVLLTIGLVFFTFAGKPPLAIAFLTTLLITISYILDKGKK